MALLAFNRTTSAFTLAAGGVTLPANLSAPLKGVPYNVTSELRPSLGIDTVNGHVGGLAHADYAALQAQISAGSVSFQWTDEPEYLTDALVYVATPLTGDDIYEITLTPGILAGGIITVTGQVTNGLDVPVLAASDVMIDCMATSAVNIITTVGTEMFNDGAGRVWLKTNGSGAFTVTVEDVTPGEAMVLRAMTNYGLVTNLPLQF
jgi:hypothetical protein